MRVVIDGVVAWIYVEEGALVVGWVGVEGVFMVVWSNDVSGRRVEGLGV